MSKASSGTVYTPENVTAEECAEVLNQHGPAGVAAEMNRLADHGLVQQFMLATVLGEMSPDAEHQRQLANAGIIDAVSQAMRKHLFNATVQRTGSTLLFNFSFHEKRAIVKADGVRALVPALTNHQADLVTQALVCRTLARICDPVTLPMMMTAGVSSGLAGTMKHNDFDAAVQEAACALLAMLARQAPAILTLVEDDIVSRLVDAVGGPYDSIEDHRNVVLFALVALIRVAHGSRDAVAQLCTERGLQRIAGVLSVMPCSTEDNVGVYDRICHLAWIVAGHPAGPNALVASGMHAHVIQAVSAFVSNPTVVARGLAALAEVSQQDGLMEQLREAGVLKACEAAVGAYVEHEDHFIRGTVMQASKLIESKW